MRTYEIVEACHAGVPEAEGQIIEAPNEHAGRAFAERTWPKLAEHSFTWYLGEPGGIARIRALLGVEGGEA